MFSYIYSKEQNNVVGDAGLFYLARSYRTFVKQRISVAIHLAAAQEIAHALDISVATDPRREA